MKEFVITPNEANQRFDKYLKKRLPHAAPTAAPPKNAARMLSPFMVKKV